MCREGGREGGKERASCNKINWEQKREGEARKRSGKEEGERERKLEKH